MLIRTLILGLVIGLPLAAVADNSSEQSVTHATSGSMPASVQPEQPMQPNNTGAAQASADNKDAKLKAQLKISGDVQEIAWNDFIKAVNDRLLVMKNAMLQLIEDTTNNKLTIVDMMKKRVDLAMVDHDLLVKQQAALNDLYASLNDEQRTNANTLLRDLILERRSGHHRFGPSSTSKSADIFD
jgi:hypothetical protein